MPKQIIYQKQPSGMPTEDCFSVVEVAMPAPQDGQVLVETHFLSIDPYMRRQMSGRGNYPSPLKPGDVMIGRGCGTVIESRHPDFAPGDSVQSEFGWREFVTLSGDGLRKLPGDLDPMSLSLGMVGQSGATAWVGLNDVAALKAGETLVVSAAAGAVGSAVGQIARLMGASKIVGIAGGGDKCRHVVEDLGFDHCIDYKAGPTSQALAEVLPDGIDVYFDNVGGEILDGILPQLRTNGRVAICGQISQYNAARPHAFNNVGALLDNCATMQGFRIGNRLDRRDEALDQLAQWFRAGRLVYRETVAEGIANAPGAFINMLSGGNLGKQVVRLK